MKLKNIGGIAPTRSIPRMLLLAMLVAVLWLLSGGTQQAEAAPDNDAFANGEVIICSFCTTIQDNSGATTETGEPLPCGIGATAWFRITAGLDFTLTFDTDGSAFDTVLAVYSGSALDNLTQIDCNDDFTGVQSEEVTFLARAGVTYHIQAGGAAGAAGILNLNLNLGFKGGVPSLINYQGLLTDPNIEGNPPVTDAARDFTFRIYGVATGPGGGVLWEETQKVVTKNGLFNLLLGSHTPLTAAVFDGKTRYLELQVEGDTNPQPIRQRFTSVPYALTANTASAANDDVLFFDDDAESLAWNSFQFELSAGLSLDGNVLSIGSSADTGFLSFDGGQNFLQWSGPDDLFRLTNDLSLLGDFLFFDSNSESLAWNATRDIFVFSDGLGIDDNLSIGESSSADSDFLYFDDAAENLSWDDAQDRFELSDDLFVFGVVTDASDRNAKANFEAVDGRELLDRLASMPIETWTFKDDESGVRHIGPTAQDFSAAFSVGADDTSISLSDENGVALVAIQELYAELRERDGRIDALEERLTALEGGGGAPQAATTSSGADASWLPIVVALLALFAIPVAGLLGGWAGRRARS